MRVHTTTSLALAAGLVLGTVGTASAAIAADARPAPKTAAAPAPALPGAEQVTRQAQALQNTGRVVKPVVTAVQEVLKAPEGKVSADRADKLSAAVARALADVREQRAGATRSDSATAPAPVLGERVAPQRADLTPKAAAMLRKQVDTMLKASVSGERQQLGKELKRTVTATVNLMASAMADGGLPAPDMAGLPQVASADGQQRGDAREQGRQQELMEQGTSAPTGAGFAR
ncbi:hypothetical protein [Streptomyces sp. NPDC054784]